MTPLRQRMLEDMRIRNLSPHTQRAYIENVARFVRYFHRSPVTLGPDEIRTYQVNLTCEQQHAPSSIEIAVCALRFLHKVTLKKPWSFDDLIPAPTKPRRLPVVLNPDEVVRVLDAVAAPKHRAILTTCYAAGPSHLGSPPDLGHTSRLSVAHTRRWRDTRRVAATPLSASAGAAVMSEPLRPRHARPWPTGSRSRWSPHIRAT